MMSSVVASVLVVHVLDVVVRNVVCAYYPTNVQKTRWYLVHGMCNTLVGIMGMRDVLMRDPAMRTAPFVLTAYLHLYHCLFFHTTWSDRMHHLIFIPLLCIPGVVFEWSHLSSLQLVFINGFPGGVLYLLSGYLRLRRRRWRHMSTLTLLLNVVIRMPGILWANYLLFLEFPPSVPRIVVAIQLVFGPLNALYYAMESLFKFLRDQSKEKGDDEYNIA